MFDYLATICQMLSCKDSLFCKTLDSSLERSDETSLYPLGAMIVSVLTFAVSILGMFAFNLIFFVPCWIIIKTLGFVIGPESCARVLEIIFFPGFFIDFPLLSWLHKEATGAYFTQDTGLLWYNCSAWIVGIISFLSVMTYLNFLGEE